MSEWSDEQHDPPATGGENRGAEEDAASQGGEGARNADVTPPIGDRRATSACRPTRRSRARRRRPGRTSSRRRRRGSAARRRSQQGADSRDSDGRDFFDLGERNDNCELFAGRAPKRRAAPVTTLQPGSRRRAADALDPRVCRPFAR